MSKLIKIKIKDVDKLEFYLSEDAKENDYISLHEINQIDFTGLQKEIDDKRNKLINEKLNELIDQEKINIINEFKQSNEYKELQEKINALKINLNEEKNNAKNAILNFKESNEYKNLEKSNQELEHQLSLKIKEMESFKLKIENDFRQSDEYKKLQEKIDKLKTNIAVLETQQNSIKEKLELEFKNKELVNLQKYNEEIEKLKRERSNNSKILGEELENWIRNEYDNSLGNIEDCKLEKTSKDINGTKPDFLFTVFHDKKSLGSVTIEAKTQFDIDKTKVLNASHFAKLDKDRKNHKSDFALLVTELEPNEHFIIKKVHDYENMYMCRPIILISFLSMVRSIYKQRETLLGEIGLINFLDKEEILNNFDSMKNDILDIQIKRMNQALIDIQENSEKIQKLAIKIFEDSKKIMNNYVEQMKNKIEKFNIKKLTKNIEKTND
ncbi:DUF2130 domain-containing protein [Mycoplasmoides pirum]|uniref:DUF2130 domain-containing protein n=1 Tax=Mycoplasmoides pirum TaxID=2122 RepID=UPI00047FC51F|nr:DUF2130 domain-containing protein [Mycoplasmoides pirum]